MFWSGSRWNNLKQRQKPIISVDINVIKLVRKSMCAIFVSLKGKVYHISHTVWLIQYEPYCMSHKKWLGSVLSYQNALRFHKLILFLRLIILSPSKYLIARLPPSPFTISLSRITIAASSIKKTRECLGMPLKNLEGSLI